MWLHSSITMFKDLITEAFTTGLFLWTIKIDLLATRDGFNYFFQLQLQLQLLFSWESQLQLQLILPLFFSITITLMEYNYNYSYFFIKGWLFV